MFRFIPAFLFLTLVSSSFAIARSNSAKTEIFFKGFDATVSSFNQSSDSFQIQFVSDFMDGASKGSTWEAS